MNERLRYSRQVALDGWGESGQKRLAGARALVVGMGGLGVPAATYLVASGIGHLAINDFDTVDETNLPRQPLYDGTDVGAPKVAVAAGKLARLNPGCAIEAIDSRLNEVELTARVDSSDVVLDASDNFATRFAVNAACVRTKTPLVSGAAIRFEAQLAVFRPDLGGPCYRCLYDERGEALENCEGQGVASPLVGLIGSAMALEAVRLIVGIGEPLQNTLLVYDATQTHWRTIRFGRDPACPVCS